MCFPETLNMACTIGRDQRLGRVFGILVHTNSDLVLKLISFTIRGYEKAYIYGNETSNGSDTMAHFHLAAILVSGKDSTVLASCVTFVPPDQVPIGSINRVG